jgi:hypothetical protein
MKDRLKSMLACSVQRGREERCSVLIAFTGTVAILGATARADHTLTSIVRKCCQQFQASAHPIDILSCFPEFAWRCIPSKMQKVFWFHLANQLSGTTWPEQVDSVPSHTGMIDSGGLLSRSSMDIITLGK